MKKLLFAIPVVVLLAAGCNSSPKASSPPPAQISGAQNTNQSPATTPTPNQITTWKTYSNAQDGFEFNYPQNYTLQTYPAKVSIKYPGDNSLEYDITFWAYKGTAAEWVQELFKEGYGNYGKEVTQKPISINSISGIDISSSAVKDVYFYTPKGFIVRINYFLGLSTDQDYITVGNQIVSSFKATN